METVPKHNLKPGFFIEVGCPGCGGQLEINSDFFITTCSHCATPLRLILPETTPAYLLPTKLTERDARFKIDRHLKDSGLPLTGQSLVYKNMYYPYWKVDAMLLRCRNRKEQISVQFDDSTGEEIIDYGKKSLVSLAPYQLTVAASKKIDCIPDSLGIRAQTLKAVPLASSKVDEDFDLLEVYRSPMEVVKTVELSISRLNSIELAQFGQNVSKIYNPTTTLLFYPYCIAEDYAGEGYRRYVMDGLSGRILSSFDSEQENKSPRKVEPKADSVFQLAGNLFEKFQDEATPLAGEPDMPDNGLRLEEITSAESPIMAPVEFGAVQVTFHRCGTCGTDLPARPSCVYVCQNCKELTSLDNKIKTKPTIMAVESPDKNASYFPFWSFKVNPDRHFGSLNTIDKVLVPAFRIPNFEALYRLTSRITTAAAKLELSEIETTDERFAPVDILPSLAMSLADIAFARFALEKTNRLPAQSFSFLGNEIALCYIPFKLENYFYVDSALNSVTFEKKLATA